MAYHNFSVANQGIEKLLQQYQNERGTIVSLMEANPDLLIKTLWNHLAMDITCQCKMGVGDIRTRFACAQCRNFRRLIDMKQDFLEKPFCLQCGTVAGKSLVIKKYDIHQPFIQWDSSAQEKLTTFSKQYPTTISQCISGDTFTISTLINMLINQKLSIKGIPSYLLHTAFICHKHAYQLLDTPSIGNIEDLHGQAIYHQSEHKNSLKSQHIAYTALLPEIAETIIQQLLVNLDELSKYNFFHGLPCSQSLLFNKDPVSYKYGNYHIKGNITVMLSNFERSSMGINKTQFFPKDPKTYISLQSGSLLPEISLSNGNFRITSRTLEIYQALCNIGLSINQNAFDFYCFMVSLMCDESFYDCIHDSPKLLKLWQSMWSSDDISQIESNIKRIHGHVYPNKYIAADVAFDIVRGNWLRSDIVQYLLKQL